MLVMRVFIAVIVLIFSLQSWTKADDIRDFQIEGISVGMSLLDFANEEKVKLSKSYNQYPNDKFIIYDADKIVEIEKYDYLGVSVKKNDKKYIVTSVYGAIYYKKLDDCLKIKTSIEEEIEKLLKFDQKEPVKYASQGDKTGESLVYGSQYYLKPYPSVESININCYHFSDKSGFKRNLKVSANSEELANFLINEAYK